MKFALGDIVRYTNKNTKEDIQGEVIGIQKYPYEGTQYMVEPFGETPNSYSYTVNVDKSDRLTQYLPYKFKPHSFNGRFVVSEKKLVTISGKSRNLVSGLLKYNPEQQGDTEDDI